MQQINNINNLRINNFYPYAIVGILIFSALIRLIGLNKGIWIDEYFSFRWNEADNFGKLIIDLRNYDKPPLYFILLYFWTKISDTEAFCRLLSIFFDIGTLFILMTWLKRYSILASILGGLYFATIPIVLRYSQEIRLYSLLMFATALTFFFASRITTKPEKLSGYVGVALSLALAISTHLVAIMLIAPMALFIVLMLVLQNKIIYWHKLISALITPCIVFLFFYLFYLKNLAQRPAEWWMPSVSWQLVSSTAKYLFGLTNLFFQSHTNQIIAFIFFAILSMALIFGKWQHNYPFLLAAVIFWLEVIIYSWLKTPIFFYRILLPGLVPFIGFFVLQVASIEVKYIQKISVLLLIILTMIFTYNWTTFQAYQPVEYYKQVAHLIKSELPANKLAIFYPGYIANTVKYYLKPMPFEAEIVVWNANDTEKLRLDINNKLAAIDKNKLMQILIVARVDLTVKQEEFKNIVSAIKSAIKTQVDIKSFLIVSHDLFFVDDLDKPKNYLSVLSSEFGQPLSYQDETAHILSTYKLQPQK